MFAAREQECGTRVAQIVQPNVGQPGFREERLEMPPDHSSVVERLAGPRCEDQVWVFARDIGLASSYDLAFAVSSQNTDGGWRQHDRSSAERCDTRSDTPRAARLGPAR